MFVKTSVDTSLLFGVPSFPPLVFYESHFGMGVNTGWRMTTENHLRTHLPISVVVRMDDKSHEQSVWLLLPDEIFRKLQLRSR